MFLQKLKSKVVNLFRPKTRPAIEMSGDYKSFSEAEKFCEGYDGKAIIEKVSGSTMAVLEGKAAYERDGFLFYEKAVNYNLMMYLYQCYIEDGFLDVCDWGGALGSTYLQHRELLESLNCRWSIVEQKHYVKFAKEHVHVDGLHFYESVSDMTEKYNLVIFSSVLQYLEHAAEIVADVIKTKPNYVVIERTPVSVCHHIWIQTVHEPIYEASYAACVYTEDELREMFEGSGYELIDSWHSLVDGDEWIDEKRVEYKSFVFKKIAAS